MIFYFNSIDCEMSSRTITRPLLEKFISIREPISSRIDIRIVSLSFKESKRYQQSLMENVSERLLALRLTFQIKAKSSYIK